MSENRTVGFFKKSKQPPMPALTEDQLDEEAVKHALTITGRLRQEAAHWRARAEEAESALAVERQDNDRLEKHIDRITHDHEREMSVLKIDCEHSKALLGRLEGMLLAGSKIFLETWDELKRSKTTDPTSVYEPKPEAVRNMVRAISPQQSDDAAPGVVGRQPGGTDAP